MSCKNVISKETINRLVKDINYIRKNPLISEGIYYKHDEEDMLKGYALIIGAEGTPYYNGYYLFEIIFPYNYPFAPPTVSFLTNDGEIRFNPNLYKNGKVCLSILNTWSGEQWTACQTLNSILLTLCSILNNNPLVNEPGISNNHIECEKYNKIITFSNIYIAIIGIVNKTYLPKQFEIFYPIICQNFLKNFDTILSIIENNIFINEIVYMNLYNIRLSINYKKIKKDFIKLMEDINKIEIII